MELETRDEGFLMEKSDDFQKINKTFVLFQKKQMTDNKKYLKAKFKKGDQIFLFPIEYLKSYLNDYDAPIKYMETNN